jgi:hypothetical protein
MRRNRFRRVSDWDGNIARMNACIDASERRKSLAEQVARERFPGELAKLYSVTTSDRCDADRAAAWVRIREIVGV